MFNTPSLVLVQATSLSYTHNLHRNKEHVSLQGGSQCTYQPPMLQATIPPYLRDQTHSLSYTYVRNALKWGRKTF